MSLLEQQNFLSEPLRIGRENDLSDTKIEQISRVLPEQVKFFADSLFYKHLREAEEFLPLTRKFLGENLKQIFVVSPPNFCRKRSINISKMQTSFVNF